MIYPASGWTSQLWRAVLTLLLAAAGTYIAWRLLSAVLPALLVMAGLLLVIRLTVGGIRRRSEW